MSHNNKQHIFQLTGLRFFLAFAIFLLHLYLFFLSPLFPEVKFFHNWMLRGHLGVDIFFVLSGFVIAYSYFDQFQEKQLVYPAYLLRRFARIYPVHLFTTIIVFVAYLAQFGSEYESAADYMNGVPADAVDFSLVELFKSMLLIQSWGLPMIASWNLASWSVSCEWLVYILFPLYAGALQSLDGKTKTTISIIALLYLVEIIAAFLSIKYQGLSAIGIIRVIPSFAIGILICRLSLHRHAASRKISHFWVLSALAVILLQPWHLLAVLILPFFMWFIYAIATKQINMSWLEHPWLIYGGKTSFSLYLCHTAVMMVFSAIANPHDFIDASLYEKCALIISYVLSSIALTVLTYHLIEAPMFRKISALAEKLE